MVVVENQNQGDQNMLAVLRKHGIFVIEILPSALPVNTTTPNMM